MKFEKSQESVKKSPVSRHRLLKAISDLEKVGFTDWSTIFLATCEVGIGVFASRDIAPSTVILPFTGNIIDFEAARLKGDAQCYTLQISHDRYMDLEAPGCFINHSCTPNAGVRETQLISLSHIPQGSEIRFDYSTTMDEDFWTMECRCGSQKCRRSITDFKYLPLSVRRHYIQSGVVGDFAIKAARQADALQRAS